MAELKRYDMKVYRAQNDMVNAMCTDLAAMGVPFFGTKAHLIQDASSINTKGETAHAEPSGGVEMAVAKITKAELLGLQKRMLQFLEDMYQE